MVGAVWPERSSSYASASAAAASSPVTPPQRVASACRQSTAPIRSRKSAGVQAYSPAATSMPAGADARTSRSPSTLRELTGSSNHVTPDARLTGVAERGAHRAVRRADLQHAAARDDRREQILGQPRGGRRAVRPPEPALALRLELYHHERRRVPFERPVRLPRLRRNRV